MAVFRFKNRNDEIVEALVESKARINDAATSLEKAIALITEYELWRVLRQDVRDTREDTMLLGRRVVGLIEFIERESTDY